MIDKQAAADVLTAALETGGNFAELFFETSRRNNVSMVNGVVEKALSGITHGCGLRVFSGLGAVYAYTNDTTPENLIEVARQMAQAVKAKATGEAAAPAAILNFVNMDVENAHTVRIMPGAASRGEVAGLLRQASESAFAYNPLVTQTANSYADVAQDVLIVNSDGLWAADRRVRSRVSVQAVASERREKQTGGFSPGASVGFELFGSLDMARLGRDSAEIAVTMLLAKPCAGGQMPVVIAGGFGGVIFHEACGHSLEATAVAKGASVFAGKLGQRIASPVVTAVDDGTIANSWGSLNIDDEGAKTRKNVLIENGVLKSYMVDRLNGLAMGMPSTGSARRESYKYAPTSRMTNTYIAAGADSEEDIIRATEYGLFAKKMGGGSVQPATGEFNFAVTEGYMIRNGAVAEPVRGATLIGKGASVLMDIDMVSGSVTLDAGVCGSVSGSVPTCVGQPMIRVGRLTVGGK